MTQKKYLFVSPARNGFMVRRGDSAIEVFNEDEFYIAETPEQVAAIVEEHCQSFGGGVGSGDLAGVVGRSTGEIK